MHLRTHQIRANEFRKYDDRPVAFPVFPLLFCMLSLRMGNERKAEKKKKKKETAAINDGGKEEEEEHGDSLLVHVFFFSFTTMTHARSSIEDSFHTMFKFY